MTKGQGVFGRLRIVSPCEVPWSEMSGEGPARFCAHCQRQVVNFSQLSAREARAHLVASGGRLCTRLTRIGGRVVLAPEPPLPTVAPGPSWRLAPAAALVSVALTLSSPGAATEEPAAVTVSPRAAEPVPEAEAAKPELRRKKSPAASRLSGRLIDDHGEGLPGAVVVARHLSSGIEHEAITKADGAFFFGVVEPGLYLLEGDLLGFEIEAPPAVKVEPGQMRRLEMNAKADMRDVTVGITVAFTDPLRRVFEQSDLVAVATLGQSRVVEQDLTTAKVVTELELSRRIRGRASSRGALYLEEQALSAHSPGPRLDHLKPGTKVLALLKATAGTVPGEGRRLYETADPIFGLKDLSTEVMAVYVERLEALARLEQGAAERGGLDPLELAEWLVETAAEPATRGEAVGELEAAFAALGKFEESEELSHEAAVAVLMTSAEEASAVGRGFDNESIAPFVAAMLSVDHQLRLSAALLATETSSDGDQGLYRLVRRWEPLVAQAWVLARVSVLEPVPPPEERQDDEDEMVDFWRLREHAWLLDQEDVFEPLFDELDTRKAEIDELWEDDDSEPTEALREARRAALFVEVRDEMVRLLRESMP